MNQRINFIVNGKPVHVDTDGTKPLLAVLRDELALRGTRFGCGTEQCGACMVLIDGKPEYSCARDVATVAVRSVTTVEGLAQGGALHPLQQAFLDEQAGQCGYCLAGHFDLGVGLAGAQSEADARRDHHRARPASLPLRHA